MTPENIRLRDWFAGQALNILVEYQAGVTFNSLDGDGWEKYVAYKAYSLADAMMLQRDRQRKNA